MSLQSTHTSFIKQKALELGFSACGIAKAEFLSDEADHLEQWLKKGMHGKMGYMENHFDMRLDPRKLVDGARSVVSLLYNYAPEKGLNENTDLQISKYAYGEDYHFVLREKLEVFMSCIRDEIGEVGGRVFVDSAPVLERAWAAKTGLGWIGKNANLLRKGEGSFFFLCELILDLELTADGPATDHCGTCTACIDACPTDAIVAPRTVDGSRCISYFTIELKDEIPSEMKGKFENWIFGCDICQDVCPWNRFSKPHQEKRFAPNEALLGMEKRDWVELTEDVFGKVFRKSAVKRTKYNGLKRNVVFITSGR